MELFNHPKIKYAPKIAVMGKIAAESIFNQCNINDTTIKLNPNVAIISINDPGVYSWFTQDHDNVLRLAFHDVLPNYDPQYTLFSAKDAEKIQKFFDKNKNADQFIVHCFMGISRSAAVAQWLCEQLNEDWGALTRFYPHLYPNHHIYNTLNEQTIKTKVTEME